MVDHKIVDQQMKTMSSWTSDQAAKILKAMPMNSVPPGNH
jgi:hypothetical protein